MRRQWTDEMVEAEVRQVAAEIGHFPSSSELHRRGRNDLLCAINRRGTMFEWADRIGFARVPSDSDTGWDGEKAFMALIVARGITCERPPAVKNPFDLLMGSALRVDVKSAKYAEYGACKGWFYRIGKVPQSDLIVMYQLDTGDFYAMPWWKVPTTSITISRGGGKYAEYLNNWPLIDTMLAARQAEMGVAAA